MLRQFLTNLFREPCSISRPANRARLGSGFEQLGDRVVPAIVVLTVNTINDTAAVDPAVSPVDQNGDCSLRSDIQYANANPLDGPWAFNHYVIDLSLIAGQTITLASTEGFQTLNLSTKFDIFSSNGIVTITPSTGEDDPIFNHVDVAAGTESHFSNLALVNGSSAFSGGSVSNSGTTFFSNCNFTNNTSATSGGAIATFSGASTTVQDCTFYCNSAIGQVYGGGAISGLTGSTTNIIDCTLSGNNTTGNGGAIYVQDADTITITGSSITGNWTMGSASLGGGGVYVSATTNANIAQTEIAANTSSLQGGSLYVFDTNLTMTGGGLDNNTAAQNGGGFYINTDSTFTNPVNYTVTLDQVSVTNNAATNGLGGGGFLNSETLAGQLNAGQLSGNTAGGNGPNGGLPGIGVNVGTFPLITIAAGQQTLVENQINGIAYPVDQDDQ